MDPILFWNGVALEANRISHTNGRNEETGPTRSSRALAIVHLAMYDAYAGIVNNPATLPRYLTSPASPGGGSGGGPGSPEDLAIAGAAHEALSQLFPSQRAFFDLAFSGVGDASHAADAFGRGVAMAILADRAADPSAESIGYTPSPQRGRHRVDPDNPGQGFHGAFYGKAKGFGITQRFKLAKPPFDNNEYRKALREVRGRGIMPELMGTLPNSIPGRTTDETLIGIYWAYDGVAEIGTPMRQYNQIVRLIAETRSPASGGGTTPATTPNTVAQNARLFAFLNVAMADAGILAWEQKFFYDFWRPVVGIREHDKSMGPAPTKSDNDIENDTDPQWLPLGAPRTNRIGKNFTPPFPAYPSGHATFGAAAFHITRRFYNVPNGNRKPDKLFKNLAFVSDEFNGVSTDNKGTVRPRHNRDFPDGLWQMIEENGRSRVFLGVHWVFDAFVVKGANNDPDLGRTDANGNFFGGVPLGLQIAEDVFAHGNGLAPKLSTVAALP